MATAKKPAAKKPAKKSAAKKPAKKATAKKPAAKKSAAKKPAAKKATAKKPAAKKSAAKKPAAKKASVKKPAAPKATARPVETSDVPYRNLFDAYSMGKLPFAEGYIVSSFFSETSNYGIYEVVSYAGVKEIFLTETGLQFVTGGKKLYILVEPDTYQIKSLFRIGNYHRKKSNKDNDSERTQRKLRLFYNP